MKTRYSKLLLAFLFLILAIFAAGGCGPPENGPYVGYYETGKKEAEGQFKNGQQDGLWTWWHANGQKSEEGHYKNGELDGLVTEWWKNGQKHSETHYKDGKLISTKEF